MLQALITPTNGQQTATNRRGSRSIARDIGDTLPHPCWWVCLVWAVVNNVTSCEGIVDQLRERDGEYYFRRVVKVCVGKSAQKIAGLVNGSKSHPDTGKGKGLSLIPLAIFTAIHLNSAQAYVVLCVQHNATTGSHRGAVGDDCGEETGRGHRGDGALAVCDVFIVDVDVIC